VSWEVWLSGGDTGEGWQGVGMQKLYDTVRAAGADNLVIVGGLDWAYDLSGVPSHRVAALEALPVTRDPGGLDGGEGDAAPLVLDDGSRTLRMTPMRSISVRLIVTSSFAIGPTTAQHRAGKSGHFYLARTGHLNFAATGESADNKYYVNFCP
jgi:hypothetical protein